MERWRGSESKLEAYQGLKSSRLPIVVGTWGGRGEMQVWHGRDPRGFRKVNHLTGIMS